MYLDSPKRLYSLVQSSQNVAGLYCCASSNVDACYRAILRSNNRDLHLHSLKNHDAVTLLDCLSNACLYLVYLTRNRSGYLYSACACCRSCLGAAFGAALGAAFGAAAGAAEPVPSSTVTSYTLPFTVIV